jgi:arginyl-tRNA synthetase
MAAPAQILTALLEPVFAELGEGTDPMLRPSSRPGFDFQVNGAMAAAKKLGRPAQEIATIVASIAGLRELCSSIEVTPQGFVNLRLDDSFVAACVAQVALDPRLGVETVSEPLKVVVDYSAPNVAKEMHAGHLRTTVIGDSLCRMLEHSGHRVVRENHVGVWGTQFGMLIEYLLDLGESEGAQELSVGDLDGFYRQARIAFESSPEMQDRSRRRVVALQAGDPETLRLWQILVDESTRYFEEVYDKLGIGLTTADIVGESFYNPMLADVIRQLEAKGLLVQSDGAKCVFVDGWTTRQGTPLPLIVQKSDGGYGYATTDLATLWDRFGRLEADLALYVVGAPQAQHLAMCFAVALRAGWLPSPERAVHVAFGSVLGPDRKIFKTRAGATVRLVDLLDEAVQRAAQAVSSRSQELGDQERESVARMVGIGAVKYADLSTDRVRDYVFDLERMVSFDGNTGPYLQYARVRCLSIFRKAGLDAGDYLNPGVTIQVGDPAERNLALALTGFAGAVSSALESWSPHKLCAYLYELAGVFTTFFENCPVLKAPSDHSRSSRLALCSLSAAVLGEGLSLLGIDSPERM